ncbi:MAG TPA: cytochrome c biogenesis protein CcsA [bacterium]
MIGTRRRAWRVWGLACGLVMSAGIAVQAAGDVPDVRDWPEAALSGARRIVIQHHGRHKPFDSFAWETLKHLTGSPTLGGQDPVATTLSLIAEPERWQDAPLIAVPYGPLRDALGVPDESAHVSYHGIIATRRLMQLLPPIVAKQQRDEKLTIAENETMDVYDRFVTLNLLFEQELDLVPPASRLERTWLPVLNPAGHPPEARDTVRGAWASFVQAVRGGDAEALGQSARSLRRTLRDLQPSAYPAEWRLTLEVWYNRLEPFLLARIAYVLAILALAAGLRAGAPGVTPGGTSTAAAGSRRAAAIGMAAMTLAAALHAGGMVARVVLAERPPVANFYETMLWLPFVAVVLAFVFEWRYRVRFFALAASILAVITLILADHLPLDSSITPIVAVLRSNLWLTVHVLTIVASYGALALAAVLAHFAGAKYLARREDATLAALDLWLYRTIQVGVVLLAAGIMLGAVWANASWGRYWGWDPKETWALITLLWFIAVLHGRFAGWLRPAGVAMATIAGFFLLLMTYYGVSFYLVGLHSYAGGNAKPIPPLLIAYAIGEAAFIALLGAVMASRRVRAGA